MRHHQNGMPDSHHMVHRDPRTRYDGLERSQ